MTHTLSEVLLVEAQTVGRGSVNHRCPGPSPSITIAIAIAIGMGIGIGIGTDPSGLQQSSGCNAAAVHWNAR
jgi:hypothetical protein